jgi:hypothetical protein
MLHTWGQTLAPASTLSGHRWRLGDGPITVDRQSIHVPVSGPSRVDGLSREISRRPAARV